jgi:hypothetical protein
VELRRLHRSPADVTAAARAVTLLLTLAVTFASGANAVSASGAPIEARVAYVLRATMARTTPAAHAPGIAVVDTATPEGERASPPSSASSGNA